jgi:hypothetical protein
MTNENIQKLTSAILMQAVRDYVADGTTYEQRQQILKDLRSSRMELITKGFSIIVAEQLELHPNEIRERVRRDSEEE